MLMMYCEEGNYKEVVKILEAKLLENINANHSIDQSLDFNIDS